MRKLVLFVGLILSLNIVFPDAPQAQVDSTKLFIYGTGFAVFPTDVGSGSKVNGGLQFKGDYRISDRISGGVTYKDWSVKGKNGDSDVSTTYMGGTGTFWAYEHGSRFNIGFMGEYGQSTIMNGGEKNNKTGIVYGMVARYRVWKSLQGVAMVTVGKYGDSKDDCLMVSIGGGFPMSLK